MDDEYAEYRCSACKKSIKNIVVACKSCTKLFYHPGCVSKHKIYDKNREIVTCPGPFEKFTIEGDKEEDMKKTPTPSGSSRDRLGSTGSIGSLKTSSSGNKTAGVSVSSDMDAKIDWLIKSIKEMKDETACKKEIKMMIKEVVREEMGDIKQELENVRRMIQEGAGGSPGGVQRSYSEAVKEKKKENVIIIKPKIQQESEATKKLIKEKVDIKSMPMGITKLKKGSNGTVIMGCETGEELKTLKDTVQAKLGENFKISESQQIKPKIKIINIGEDEMKLVDDDLIATIKRQNRIETANDKFHMRIVKRIFKEKKNDNSQLKRNGKEGGCVIIEIDEETHDLVLKKGKVNVGWKKCPAFNHINVKRCFKCWGFYHIAKNCTRSETCHKCAGNHTATECQQTKRRCVNCMFKNRTYNLKINDEHDALSSECPTFKRAMQEEKRRAGWEDK
jgi:hypothetical protein